MSRSRKKNVVENVACASRHGVRWFKRYWSRKFRRRFKMLIEIQTTQVGRWKRLVEYGWDHPYDGQYWCGPPFREFYCIYSDSFWPTKKEKDEWLRK